MIHLLGLLFIIAGHGHHLAPPVRKVLAAISQHGADGVVQGRLV